MKESVHNCVADLRIQKGVTQQELADALDVSRQTIFAIERGNYSPSIGLALRIAKYFRTSVEKVFSLQ